MRAPRVGPWGPKVRGGGAARGAPWVAVETVSGGGMGCVPPWWRPRQAASVHIRSGGRDREVESAEATVPVVLLDVLRHLYRERLHRRVLRRLKATSSVCSAVGGICTSLVGPLPTAAFSAAILERGLTYRHR